MFFIKTICHLISPFAIYPGCIVEGVETSKQRAILNEMGFRYIQGYYFSQPLLPADALEFIGHKDDVFDKLIA